MSLLIFLLALTPPASAEEEVVGDVVPRESWFKKIRYAVGVSSQFGGGSDGTTFGRHLAVEPIAFELRSFLWPRFAFHTTLNLGRMIAPAVQSQDARLDYDCHLGGHIPLGEAHTFVVAPGASIAYSFTGSGYERFVGDVRLGVDFEHGAWTTGLYVRPYAGWWRDVGAAQGSIVGGGVFEIVNVYNVPKKGQHAVRYQAH